MTERGDALKSTGEVPLQSCFFLFFLLDTGSAEFLNTLGLVVNFSNQFEEYHHPVGQGLRW